MGFSHFSSCLLKLLQKDKNNTVSNCEVNGIWCISFWSTVLSGPGIEPEHCIMESIEGTVVLHPIASMCQVNGLPVGKSQRISQGGLSIRPTIILSLIQTTSVLKPCTPIFKTPVFWFNFCLFFSRQFKDMKGCSFYLFRLRSLPSWEVVITLML